MSEKVKSYQEETVLGVGFTRRTGLGYVVGTEFARLGADLVVGGSSTGSVNAGIRGFKRAGIEESALSPFVADLTDSAQIDEAVASLQKPPSIVIYASALGMEGFFLEMNNYLNRMKAARLSGAEDATQKIEDEKRKLRDNLQIWLPEGYANALAVNRTAPEYLVGRLADRFKEPFKFVYVNSTFGYLGEGPIHYRNVYQTKHLTSKWMSDAATTLAIQGVDMHEEIDPVIADTDIGVTIIGDILPFWDPKIQGVVGRTKVNRRGVFGSIKAYTDLSPDQRSKRPFPNRHFLLTVNGEPTILDEFPAELKIDAKEFDF